MAASTQADAAKNAAQLQYQESQNALNFQKQQWQTEQGNIAPWIQAGQGGLANLSYLLGIGPNPGGGGGGTPGAPGMGGGNVPGMPTGNTPGMPAGRFGSNPPPAGPGAFPTSFSGQGDANPRTAVGTPGIQGINTAGGAGGPLSLGSFSPAASGGSNQRIAANQPMAAPTNDSSKQFVAPSIGSTGTPAAATNPSSAINTSLGGFGSLMQPWNQTFQAPTNVTEQNDPGYQFRLQQGQSALQNSAAAQGGLLSGGTLAAQQQYGQDYASNEYNNVYNRAFNQYSTNYNQFQQGQANQFNRLASLAGMGQTSAGQLGMLGQQAANNVSNISLGAGQQIGQNINNAGAATASGYAGVANSLAGGIGNIGQMMTLQQLLNQNQPVNYGNFTAGDG